MRSARTNDLIAAAWLLFWLLMITNEVQGYLREGGRELWKPVLWSVSSAITGTLLPWIQRRYSRRHDKLLGTPRQWFAHQLLWLPMYWIAFVPITFAMRHGVYALLGQRYHHEPWLETFLYEDVRMTVFFGAYVVILFGMLSYHALQQEKLRAEQANALLRQAQLQQLTQQMQPHFLFNALNTISSLMHADVERADASLLKLAEVLRATLDMSAQHQAPLETELRLLRAYAHLMGERFAERVHFTWHIEDAALPCQVPVMSMQPLLENIFKHTVERRRQPTAISISARRVGDALVLRLEDDAGRLDTARATAGHGVGMRNLRQRLAAMHGPSATVELQQLSPAGVRTELRLPCA
ncbi:histidine kinase [Duganella sp. LX20W]|uniref:Histidine kinase n=1 Tax=Rugamonas brunnea TaxID=2758569 RepID=A0A7W2IC75_9BURK|nr:histidine kinase [Rugamonas brunnea]MBA5637933.1 histidine kinase [Rugamonas brunnea]